jgi:hypothetical protein
MTAAIYGSSLAGGASIMAFPALPGAIGAGVASATE